MPWRIADEGQEVDGSAPQHHPKLPIRAPSIADVLKAMFLIRRRLQVIPRNRIHFLDELGKHVSSAVKLKNTSRSFVAIKLQTNSDGYSMWPPLKGILAPGETVTGTVVKFIEPLKQRQQKKGKEMLKVVSLKVKQGTKFTPGLFEERKECVAIEQLLEVVFLDPQSKSPEIEKLKKRLAEAKAAQQAPQKPTEDKTQKMTVVGGV